MANRPPKFQLIEDRLGTDLAGFIQQRRSDQTSFENIARELWATTGINVTAQTVANWEAAYSPAHDHSPTEAGAA